MAGRPPPLEALKASLRVVRLPEAYVIYYASTGLLEEELFAIEPHAPITVGFGSAHGIDPTGYRSPAVPYRKPNRACGSPELRTPGASSCLQSPQPWTKGVSAASGEPSATLPKPVRPSSDKGVGDRT